MKGDDDLAPPRVDDVDRVARVSRGGGVGGAGRASQAALAAPRLFARGFSRRKRPLLRAFAQRSDIRFIGDRDTVPPGATLFVWGRAEASAQALPGVQVVRVEDGFLHSVGLGADLVRPLSWVLDARGIYYDASAPSELEDLLATGVFDDELRARAAALRARIATAGLSKYNLSFERWRRPASATRVVLVPGQVESDASIRHGAQAVHTNLGLLRRVREENPGAYLLYKPHPDVLAGLRARGAGEDAVASWCDEVVGRVGIADLLGRVDEVHVMTSLTGFEALLRGRRVVCHGQPFYAGWGLTDDRAPIARRTRRLALDELVAATLLLYPRYVNWEQGRLCSAEDAVAQLLAWRERAPRPDAFWRRLVRPLLRRR